VARDSLGWLAGTLAYLVILYLPLSAAPTLAAIITGIIVAWASRSAGKAFLLGAAAGGTAVLMIAGAWIGRSLSIVASAAGGGVALLSVAYHLLAPALLAAGFTVFFQRSS